jgi:hypothetical protein
VLRTLKANSQLRITWIIITQVRIVSTKLTIFRSSMRKNMIAA